jgi:hypothetical protein
LVEFNIASEEAQKAAKEKFEEAIRVYAAECMVDDTVQITGYIIQLSVSGVMAGERLGFQQKGTTTERLGLLRFVNENVENSIFDPEYEE